MDIEHIKQARLHSDPAADSALLSAALRRIEDLERKVHDPTTPGYMEWHGAIRAFLEGACQTSQ